MSEMVGSCDLEKIEGGYRGRFDYYGFLWEIRFRKVGDTVRFELWSVPKEVCENMKGATS